MSMAQILAAMAQQRMTGGANNIPKTTDPTTVDTPSQFNTPQTTYSGDPITVRPHEGPGVIAALTRAGRSAQDMYNERPGQMASLLGMISKGLVAGKSTYDSSYYNSAAGVEKPTMAGMFGDLAMQMGENRSVADYLKSGDERQLGLVSPQNATLARERLDRREMEETRQKERDADIERADEKERRDRMDATIERHQRWKMFLQESEKADERMYFTYFQKKAFAEYDTAQKAFTSQGGTKGEFLDTITKLDDLERARTMELENNERKHYGASGQRRKGAMKINQDFINRYLEDLRSGDPNLMYPAADAINAIYASQYDLRAEATWPGYVKVEKRRSDKVGTMEDASYGFSNTRENPGLTENVRPDVERPFTEIEAELSKTDKATHAKFDRMEQRVQSEADAPAPRPAGPPPELPSVEDITAQAKSHVPSVDVGANTASFYQTERPFGPLPGDPDPVVLGGVTLTWNEALARWEPYAGQ